MKKTNYLAVGSAFIVLSASLVGCSSTPTTQNTADTFKLPQDQYANNRTWHVNPDQKLQSINFKFDSTAIDPNWYQQLDSLAATLKDNPKIKVTLIGHTDSRGSNDYNDKLAIKRCESIANYLENKGVSSTQIHIYSRGETLPVVDNANTVGHHFNRRVDLIIQPIKS